MIWGRTCAFGFISVEIKGEDPVDNFIGNEDESTEIDVHEIDDYWKIAVPIGVEEVIYSKNYWY